MGSSDRERQPGVPIRGEIDAMATVHDVAALSGVSIATVSRTLREPHRVTEQTRERVMSAVRQLGYQPNRAAAGLRGGRTGVIALVVPDIENPHFASLTKGAQASTRARGYGLVVVDTTERRDVEREELRAIAPQVDGVILASSRLDADELAAVAESTACVLVHRNLGADAPHTPTVTIDEVVAAELAVRELHEQGHRRLTYVGGPPEFWTSERRCAAVRRAAADLGDVEITVVEARTTTAQGGRDAAAAVLASDPTAVLAYNDLVALGLLATFTELGIRVPADLSLIGFDDTFVASLSSPPLTSVSGDPRALGETAVDLLLGRLDGRDAEAAHHELRPHLVVRGSTAPPRAPGTVFSAWGTPG